MAFGVGLIDQHLEINRRAIEIEGSVQNLLFTL
jgi:hypothetical protein